VTVAFVEPRTHDRPDLIQAVVDLHLRWFGDYAYAVPELLENGELPADRDDRVVHQILALVDDAPAGYAIVHTNTLRRVGITHFLAVDEPFRSVTVDGRRLARALIEHAASRVVEDAGRLGLDPFLGLAAEAEAEMVPVWERWGFEVLPVEYHEPHFGVRWPEHGAPTFFDRTLVGRPAPGADLDPVACGRAAAAAYLLDHYRLPADHPEVAWLTSDRDATDPGHPVDRSEA
jgi:hypothetical protein